MKFVNKTTLIIAALFCLSLSSYAQYSSKEELKEAANKMFEEKDYGGSLKLFSQLLSTYPKDPNYNYKYGACVLFGARDKDEALDYLKFAVTKSNVDPVAFYFLGKGYHHEYEFSKALKNYKLFKEKATSKDQKKYSVDREIEMCQNGGTLLKSMVDIGVLSKKEIKESDFFRSYKLNGIGGTIIVKPEQFKTKLDKKNNEKSIVYLGQAKDMILFSSYGKNGANGKDIYKSVKNSNGDWGEATLFSDNINSQFDEDYPFLHPDGKTLYFSSKGYTSMGGYDIFKSTFNAITKEWSTPQNLDFPINTPDDDILYISDMENKLAYFASSRASKQGELTVYNVAVKSVPFIHSVINGFFIAESNPKMKNATITVRAIDKDRRYGIHKTKSETGEYLLMFPANGGKFKILVETSEGAPVHSAIIEIPKLKNFRALKQELRLVGEGADEKLIVKNLFDESDSFDMNNPLVVQNILKERAKMEVNITEEELNSSTEFLEEEEIFAGDNLNNSLGTSLANALNKSAYKELSDQEITEKTNETVSKIISQIEISRVNSISSYKIADDKSYEAKLLFTESEQLIIDAESAGSEKEKQEKTVLAESKKMDAAMLVNEVVVALAIAKTLDNEMIERGSDLDRVKSLQGVINAKIDSKERELAEVQLNKLDEIAAASYHNESALDIESEIVNDNFLTEEKKYNKLTENIVDLNDRENDLRTSIKKLNEKKEQTKKKKEVEGIDAQIKSLEFDIEDTQYDLEKARKKIDFAKVAYLQSKSEAAITQSVIAMLNGEDNGDAEITDSQKIKIENDLVYFKKKGLVGLFEQEEFASLDAIESESREGTEVVAAEKEESVAVVNSEGLESKEVVSVSESEEIAEATDVEEVKFAEEATTYKGGYEAELANFNGEDTYESSTLKAAIHENWAKDIEEEITLKKANLSIVNDAEKKGIENDIAILEYSLLEQEEFASLYAIESESLQGTEVVAAEIIEPVGIVSPEGLESEEVVRVSENEEEIAEETDVEEADFTEEPTTYQGKHAAELANFSGEETYESSTLKAAIYENWAKDIEEEITLKKADLSIVNGAEKKGLENDIAILEYSLLEQEEFASLYAIESESLQGTEVIAVEKVEPVGIVNSEGLEAKELAIISESEEEIAEADVEEAEVTEEPTTYKGKYEAELANFSGKDTYESSILKAAIHENWAKDIEEEITLKQADLTITNGAEKKGLENDIAILEYSLLEQEEFASLYAFQSESLQGTEVIAVEKVESVGIVNSEGLEAEADGAEFTESEEEIAEATDVVETEFTEEPTTYKGRHEAELASFSGKDTYESSTLKAEIHENWAKDIEEEITLKKAGLSIVNATEKEKLENDIAILEYSLLEQEEFASLYAFQSESLQGTEVVAANELKEENLTKNNLNAEEDDFSNFKYNNQFNYKSPQSKTSLAAVSALKEEAKSIKEKGDVKLNEASKTSNDEEKERLTLEAEVLYEKSNRKQERIAKVYEGANRSEYYNNQTEVSELKKDNTINPIHKTIAGLMMDEASNYYDEAKLKRATAVNAASFSAKENMLQQAYELEMKAIETQKRAVLKLVGKDVYPVVAEVNNGTINEEDNNEINKELNSDPGTKESVIALGEELSLADKEVISALEPTTITTVKQEASYIEYAGLKKEKRRLVKEAQVEYVKAKQVDKDIDRQKQLIVSLNAVDETTETEVQSTNRVLEIEKIEKEISGNEIKRITLRKRVKEIQASAQSLSNQADAILANTNEATAKNYAVIEKVETFDSNFIAKVMRKSVNSTGIKEPTVNTTRVSLANIDNIPTVLKESIFVINKNTAVYNESKRIPVSPKLPEGLVFKVQIGAFRNPIPQSHFRGFAPIMAENAGKGITRYTAGLFKTFNMANEAKGSIRSIGYSDAFVVAFFNGKRINMTQARGMLNGGAANTESFANNTDNVKTNNSQNTNTPIAPKVVVVTKEVKDGRSKDVRNIEGVFFTIQVGVYSKEVTVGQLNNVSPLNSERTASGLIRYTSGVFTTLEEANAVKERIRADGIPDAFVVAYSNGVKTTVAAAKTELELNVLAPSNEVSAKNLTIKFKVQLGEYTSDVPLDEAGLFLKLTSRGIKNYIQGDKTIYIIGSFKAYSSATDLQNEMKEMGVKNPKVVAFQKSKAIDLNEALKRIENK